MDIKLKKYALYTFIQSIILGFLFVWFFTWKAVGISFPIYVSLLFFSIFITVFIVEGRDYVKRINKWFLLTLFLLLTSFVFVFRLSNDLLIFAFITLPFFYAFVLIGMFNKKVYENFGILSYIAIPIALFLSGFVDIFKYISNLKIEASVDKKTKNIANRVLAGFLLSIPVLFVLVILFSSADSVFANYISMLWEKTIMVWFKDINALFSLVSKSIIGIFISITTMVFNFALYNKESFLNNLVNKTDWMKIGNWKRNWDVVISSTFMFFVNILFVFFIVIQFSYLFGGEKNINGLNLSLTYAEYARRGFFELIILSTLVFVVAFILNYKVYVQGTWQKVVYRFNHVLLVLSVLVISYSANSRLMLYESAYGYTNLRIFIHLIIVAIAIMYIVLYISLLFKKGEQFVNVITASLIAILYFAVVLIPFDSVTTYLNYKRLLSTGKIDSVYLFNSSPEVIPVVKLMVKDEGIKPEIKEVLLANVQKRLDRDFQDKRGNWQSYNFTFEKIKNGNVFALKMFDENLDQTVQKRINSMIDQYAQLLKDDKFDEAFAQYWSPNTKKISRGGVGVKVFDYTIEEGSSTLSHWLYNPSEVYITMDVDVKYSIDQDTKNAYFPEYSTSKETLYLRNYDGVWKIVDSTLLKLGGVGSEIEDFKGWKHLSGNYFENIVD